MTTCRLGQGWLQGRVDLSAIRGFHLILHCVDAVTELRPAPLSAIGSKELRLSRPRRVDQATETLRLCIAALTERPPRSRPQTQRFIGEISADGKTIEGRWERGTGDAGDDWELDFPINYVRK
jgi:hypothetical protein